MLYFVSSCMSEIGISDQELHDAHKKLSLLFADDRRRSNIPILSLPGA